MPPSPTDGTADSLHAHVFVCAGEFVELAMGDIEFSESQKKEITEFQKIIEDSQGKQHDPPPDALADCKCRACALRVFGGDLALRRFGGRDMAAGEQTRSIANPMSEECKFAKTVPKLCHTRASFIQTRGWYVDTTAAGVATTKVI